MLYKSVLENMQKADHTLRVCLGGAQYKKLKNIERRAMDLQKVLLEVRTFMERHPTNQTVKDLKTLAPELNVGILSNYLKDDAQNLWTVVRPIQLKCQKAFKEIRQIMKVKPGAEELYQRMLGYKAEYTRLHFNINAPSHEAILTGNAQYTQRMKSQVEEIDRLMAKSIYRNQKGITHAEFHQNNLELYSLDLIAQNYTAETSINLPECEVLRMTPMWKYVGKGIEVIQVRVDELNELQNRFFEVEGVAEIIQQMATDRQALEASAGAEFVEKANGDMVATETFDDEYVEQITDVSLNPELLSVEGLNTFGHTGGGCRQHMFAGHLTDEQMREKLLVTDEGASDRDYLMTWTEGAQPQVDGQSKSLTQVCREATAKSATDLLSEKAYLRGCEPVEVDLSMGGPIGFDPTDQTDGN